MWEMGMMFMSATRKAPRVLGLALAGTVAFSGLGLAQLGGAASLAFAVEDEEAPRISLRSVPDGGWGDLNNGTIHLGGYWIENGPDKGTFAWCSQLGRHNPLNDQLAGQVVTSLKSGSGKTVSGLNLAKINYLMSTVGSKPESPSYDAGLAIAIWYFVGDVNINGIADPGVGLGWAGVNMFEVNAIPAQYRADVKKYFNQHVAAANAAITSSQLSIAEPAKPVMSLAKDGLSGSITVPAGHSKVTLTGAVTSDGAQTITKPGTYNLVPVRPAETKSTWKITAKASGTINEAGKIAKIKVHKEPSGQQQVIVSGVGDSRSWSQEVSATVDQRFSITGDSQVPEALVQPGEAIQDVVTLTTLDGKPWPLYSTGKDKGKPMRLTVDVKRYELPRAHVQGEPLPEDAVVAEEFSFVADKGATSYQIGETLGDGGAFSNWVFSIDAAAQPKEEPITNFLPSGFKFEHEYGLERESLVVPMTVDIETELSKDTVAWYDEITDFQTVSSVGAPYMYFEGKEIPTVWENRVFFIEDATLEELEQQAEAPEDAELIGTFASTVTESGTPTETDPFEVPGGREGVLTVQPCLVPEQQDEAVRDLLVAGCEDFGVPTQSAQVVAPTFRSEGSENVVLSADARVSDVVFMENIGENAEYEVTLETFEEKKNAKGELVCETDARVFKSEEPLTVTADHDSEKGEKVDEFTPKAAAPLQHVLTVTDKRTGEVVRKAECGEKDEQTVVVKTPVELALTGAGSLPLLGIAAAALLGGGGVLAAAMIRRRKLSAEG